MNNSVLRVEENGVEYFTIVATGESGMSQIGLARVTGKRLSTIQNLSKNLTDGKAPKRLQRFIGQDIYLTDGSSGFRKKGGKVHPYKANFCFAVIRHYDKLGSEMAEKTLDAIGEMGMESYIQGKTRWLPEKYQSSKSARTLVDYILNNPKEWDLHFKTNWRKEACRATGWAWQSRIMAWLIANYIYKPLGKDVYLRLLQVNPDRKVRHHQFFDATADELVLKEHIQQVGGLLKASHS